MAIEKQESHIGLTKQRSSQTDDELRYFFPHQTFNSLGSLPSATDAIITIDDDEEKETLEPKKKQRLGSWWDDVESFNELSCVVKTKVDSCLSSTDLPETKKKKKKKDDERSSLSSHHDNFIDLCEDEIYSESIASNHKGNQVHVGYGDVALEDSGVSVEDLKSKPWEALDPAWEIRSETMDPWLGGYVRDIMSPVLGN